MLDNRSRKEPKIITIVVLVLCACGLTYYFHDVLAQGMIFTHLFYIPVILACVWWKKKGMFVPVFLGSALILSHLFWSTDVPIANDVLRAVMFVFVGLTVVVLKELLEKEETSRIDTVTESEKKYRLLADNVEDVIWTMDMDLNRVYTSPSVERLRGFTPRRAGRAEAGGVRDSRDAGERVCNTCGRIGARETGCRPQQVPFL